MVEKCAVCGANIDMTFEARDMRDFSVIEAKGDQAELRVKYVCNYCGIGFERIETVPIVRLRAYSENQGFDR